MAEGGFRLAAATDHSDKTLTLTGTDENGRALTEAVTGPGNAATVESTKYFKTLTTVSVSATVGADTLDVGWVDEVASKIIPLNWRSESPATITVDVTGTLDFTVQQTFDHPLADRHRASGCDVAGDHCASAKTADTIGAATLGATAIRIILNSYSSAAELQANIIQPTGVGV